MEQNSVSYRALKSIIKHMEANKRIQIAAACPSLRNIEKYLPLTIENLTFHSNYVIQINEKFYKFGIIREYREGNPTKTIEEANKEGGIRCDLDEWGFIRPSYGWKVTPGDCFFQKLPGNEYYSNDDLLTLRKKMKYNMARYGKTLGAQWDDVLKTALLPYECREKNLRPAHDCYIQLSFLKFIPQTVAEPIGRIPYNRNLYEAMNSFMKFIFKGRRPVIQVKRLSIVPTHIIRLPEGVKFSIRELKTCGSVPAVFEIISPLLDQSCLPINHINQNYLENLDHPCVRDAEELTFSRLDKDANLFGIIQNLPFLRVNFLSRYRKYDTEELITFIKNLLENDEIRIGTTYRIGFEKKENLMESLDEIEQQLEEKVAIDFDNELLILQMNNSKKIQISYRTYIDNLGLESVQAAYVLKVEVVASSKAPED